jgi:hypothetical protein
MHKRMRRIALAVTAAVLVAVAGGVTYALADIGDGGVINGCYGAKKDSHDDDDDMRVKSGSRGDDDGHHGVSGQLRVIDPAKESCRRNEKPISWSQAGPQGPPGDPAPPLVATGLVGPTGIIASNFSSGIMPVITHVGPGQCDISITGLGTGCPIPALTPFDNVGLRWGFPTPGPGVCGGGNFTGTIFTSDGQDHTWSYMFVGG